MSDSGQKFIKRNRPPRVHISYQDPYEANKQVELPFVMGIMADLSGNASEVPKLPMADRKFASVDMDNFDSYMESLKPAVAFRTENKLSDKPGEQMGVKLTFTKMADFEPGAIARQVPALKALLEAREQLANLQRYMDGKVAAETKLRELLSNPELMKAMKEKRDEALAKQTDTETDESAEK
jgi:type VI secretion system protein ImpB